MLVLGSGDPDIDHLRPGCFQYCPGLLHVDLGSKPSLIAVLIQIQSLLVLSDSIPQQLFFGVQAACGEVIHRQVRVHTQVHDGQIGGTRLRLFPIGLYIAAHGPTH